jgi:hypothetical protein
LSRVAITFPPKWWLPDSVHQQCATRMLFLKIAA